MLKALLSLLLIFVMDTSAQTDLGIEQHSEMVLIPAGTFLMGCVPGDESCEPDEKPRHKVKLDAFYIHVNEVTVHQYSECVKAGACQSKDFANNDENTVCNYGREERELHPMNCVSWRGADKYCRWAGERLPTEAEWEAAARGGLDGKVFPWGDQEPDCDRAVMNYGGYGCGEESTWRVGSKPEGRNGYGLNDMAGNVWEWCADWYEPKYYSRSHLKNPRGLKAGHVKVLRGGCWDNDRWNLRVSSRDGYYPDDTVRYFAGFRCAKDPRN